ncbi:MAG: 50S ribosomal protein L31 [Anaplasmataceae bacterium]|nr:50S ribosomal protein L31 [Anaplasmataceae bacterium]
MSKADIHPTYFPKATVTCGCGNSFVVGATREKIEVEICSKCHPFYTGEEKLIDTAGKVEKFKSRQAKAAAAPKKEKKTRSKKPQASATKKIK